MTMGKGNVFRCLQCVCDLGGPWSVVGRAEGGGAGGCEESGDGYRVNICIHVHIFLTLVLVKRHAPETEQICTCFQVTYLDPAGEAGVEQGDGRVDRLCVQLQLGPGTRR